MALRSDLTEQIAYYRARASEYDEWFLRRGRYDHGEEHARRWFDEVAQVGRALDTFQPKGEVLELACGTGWWTEQLEPYAASLTAVDASPEVIALNQARVQSKKVGYVQADLFAWHPQKPFDTIFFSFWLSHVPPERFDSFWRGLQSWLKPGGRVFFIDSLFDGSSTAKDHQLRTPHDTVVSRRLNDGRTFDIVKVFYDPPKLAARLEALRWRADIGCTESFFLYGSATPM